MIWSGIYIYIPCISQIDQSPCPKTSHQATIGHRTRSQSGIRTTERLLYAASLTKLCHLGPGDSLNQQSMDPLKLNQLSVDDPVMIWKIVNKGPTQSRNIKNIVTNSSSMEINNIHHYIGEEIVYHELGGEMMVNRCWWPPAPGRVGAIGLFQLCLRWQPPGDWFKWPPGTSRFYSSLQILLSKDIQSLQTLLSSYDQLWSLWPSSLQMCHESPSHLHVSKCSSLCWWCCSHQAAHHQVSHLNKCHGIRMIWPGYMILKYNSTLVLTYNTV